MVFCPRAIGTLRGMFGAGNVARPTFVSRSVHKCGLGVSFQQKAKKSLNGQNISMEWVAAKFPEGVFALLRQEREC